MNLREGSRRLALLLGVLGCLAACALDYQLTTENYRLWHEHSEYERLLHLSSVQKAIAAHEDQFKPWNKYALPPGAVLDRSVMGVGKDGVTEVKWFSETEPSEIFSIRMEDGSSVLANNLNPSAWWIAAVPLLPLVGFLIPYGVTKVLAWVIMGFTTSQ